ncbi:MAG: hypothetical protein NZ700_09210 [Gemmataceae bacterium]|nr:hypothetical protein [Gemmataceae bacterium]MDW8264176.1 hypothetical protein [Gemmataceae bacterium]
MSTRPPSIRHTTSEPYVFFGRKSELELLERAFDGEGPSVVAFVGPGGQGKTAIVQHWLEPFVSGERSADGVFLWSFYRGKDADLCLRELYAYAFGRAAPGDVSASYCVDRLVPLLRRERWALVFDGAEVVQHETDPWLGRWTHPDLSRLVEELASEPLPGVVILTSRFPFPELERRPQARIVSLGGLDAASGRGLLRRLGVQGRDSDLESAVAACGAHAKAVELLGTYLHQFHGGVCRLESLPPLPDLPDASPEERHVLRVLTALQTALTAEQKDLLALATAFREPLPEPQLRDYLTSPPVRTLLHQTWGRTYPPFAERPQGWLAEQIETLVALRLLERVGRGPTRAQRVIDAHPLVRRSFGALLGAAGQHQGAVARAGFLRGRPDRRRPESLEDARADVELFHAYCDAGLWNEADSTYVSLENPKHRFLAPAFERDLLLRFFPERNWRRAPLWPGFGRQRSLAICFELLGQFADALAIYPQADVALRGDALIALGQLQPLLEQPTMPAPWQSLWLAYRCHALSLVGRAAEAVSLARSLVPVDVYEWVHVFECLLRIGQLRLLDLRSVLFRATADGGHRWAELARRRMRADYLRLTHADHGVDLEREYQEVIEAYDRGGLPFERALTRLSFARWSEARGRAREAATLRREAAALACRFGMKIIEADATDNPALARQRRAETGYQAEPRP